MDKEEFRIKLEEINNLVEKKDYKTAMGVVDSIDWRKVKSARTLSIVGEIYAANKRYEDSMEILLLAYHRAGIGKNILYRLIEISLKMGNLEEADDFYKEYTEIAPNDNARYILQYKILKTKNAPIQEQIQVLEEYKEKEFTERWSYELAKLYYKAGDKERCIDLCDTMILWFSEGKYVMKAMDLKMRMGVLTGEERRRYEEQFVPKLITPEDIAILKENLGEEEEQEVGEGDLEDEVPPPMESIKVKKDEDKKSQQDVLTPAGKGIFQEKLTKGFKDIFGKKKQTRDDGDFDQSELDKEEITAQMNIKRRGKEEDAYGDVPFLEPEMLDSINREEEQNSEDDRLLESLREDREEQDDIQEEKEEGFVFKQPKPMDIPPSMKTSALPDPELIRQILNEKKQMEQQVAAASEKTSEDPDEKMDFDFNLEDTILAAATAQGIQFADGSVKDDDLFVSETPEEEEFEEEPLEEEQQDSVFSSESPEEIEDISIEKIQEEVEKKAELYKESTIVSKEETPENIPDLEEEVISILPEEEDTAEADEIEDLGQEELEEPVLAEEEKPELKKFSEQVKKILEQEEKEKTPETEEEKLESFIDSINPEPEIDPTDIIPRSMKLTKEEEQLFTYFVQVPGMKEQLLDMLADMQDSAADKTSKTGNIVVMGARETGKTRLISAIIPAVCKELHMEAAKVAYVFAEQINGKDIAKIIGKLSGGFLVIENANQMDQATADRLNKAMEFRTDGLTVILEDEKIGMRKFLARYPKLAKKFTSMINIPVFTNDELVNFAKIYTSENGYSIDQMGLLALYNMISQNQKEDEPMTIGGVKNLVDDAIAKSQSGMRKLKRNLSKTRVDRDGFIILYEKDFS